MRGQPIVCTVSDAIICFIQANLDCLVLDNFLIDQQSIPKAWIDYCEYLDFELDRTTPSTVYTFL
jgi:hypothetical protein